MFNTLLAYRYRAFSESVGQLWQQFKQLGLLVVTIFYTALPGLVLLLFLGIGQVLESDKPSSFQALIAWLLLLVQTVQFIVLSDAHQNRANRHFQRGLSISPWPRRWCDFILMAITHPLLWGAVIIFVTMDSQDMLEAKHFPLFILVQGLLAFVAGFRPFYAIICMFLYAISLLFSSQFGLFRDLYFLGGHSICCHCDFLIDI